MDWPRILAYISNAVSFPVCCLHRILAHYAKDRSQRSMPLRQRKEIQDQAAAHASVAAKQVQMDARQDEQRAWIQDYRKSMQEAQALDNASNAVVDLVKAGKLDEAERATRELLVRYPEVHDGHDRLGMVYEARGRNREAAGCYRRVIDFIRARPKDHDPEMEAYYLELIATLDLPAGRK